VLNAPILPFLGMPFFIIGFPRPLRIWPTAGASFSKCDNSSLYQTLENDFIKKLPSLIKKGDLGRVEAGNIYLFRSEFYIIWLEILECGQNFVTFVMKGLELQTTSCHAAEATYLDGLLKKAFEEKSFVNVNFFHVFVVCFPFLEINFI